MGRIEAARQCSLSGDAAASGRRGRGIVNRPVSFGSAGECHRDSQQTHVNRCLQHGRALAVNVDAWRIDESLQESGLRFVSRETLLHCLCCRDGRLPTEGRFTWNGITAHRRRHKVDSQRVFYCAVLLPRCRSFVSPPPHLQQGSGPYFV